MTNKRASDPTPESPIDGAANASVGNPASFETSMSELEALVHAMESGSLTLEQSLAAYQRGAALVASCRQSLTGARQQVRILEAELLKVFEAEAADADGDAD